MSGVVPQMRATTLYQTSTADDQIRLATAVLKLQNQKESKEALNQVLPRAAATFAETKREAAQSGWWMQLPNDRWVQK